MKNFKPPLFNFFLKKSLKKGFYLHFKFEGDNNTLTEIEKKIKVDRDIVRHLTVRYSKLDTKNEFFKNNSMYFNFIFA